MLKLKAVSRQKNEKEDFNKENRQDLISRLLNNEKILGIIYDKTFYDRNEVKNEEDLSL